MSADIIIRASLLLAAAWLATAALRRGTAATRHRAWTMAFVAVLALPASKMILPAWPVLPAAPVDIGSVVNEFGSPGLSSAHGSPEGLPHKTGVAQPFRAADGVAQSFRAAEGVAQPFRAAEGIAHPFRALSQPSTKFSVGSLLLATWAVVFAALALRMVAGIVGVRRLARAARPASPRARAILDALLADRSVATPIRLLVSGDVSMPMAWGSRRGILILPRDAEQWSDDRMRVVLLHEVAHVLRADSVTNGLARLAVACHWFNPLAWVALRAMTAERERACDDYVIASGAVAADYAQHLLDIARSDLSGATWSMAPAMARRSELEGRLLAILTPHRVRERRAVAFGVTVAAIAAAALVSAASPEPGTPATPPATAQATPKPEPQPAPRRPSVVTETMKSSDEDEARSQRGVRDALAAGLEDSSEDVREKAAMGLAVRSEDDVVPLLIEALNDPSAQVREKAALGLAFRRGPTIVDALLKAAGDEDSQVREKALFGLGMSGDTRALPVLTAATKDPDPQVREKAVQGLAFFSARRDSNELVSADSLRDIVRGVAAAMATFSGR